MYEGAGFFLRQDACDPEERPQILIYVCVYKYMYTRAHTHTHTHNSHTHRRVQSRGAAADA
jgi:hypothetical protein